MHGRAETGRARPPKVELVATDGSTCEGYLKSPQLHEAKSPFCLEREWIATRLAKTLSLPCADVVAVEVTPDFLNLAETLGMTEFHDGPELVLASVSLGPGWSEWSSAITVSKSQCQKACEIYFFDTLIQNWDRVMPNPNLLIRDDAYGMIDHEESFVEAAGTNEEKSETPRPWVSDGIVNDVGEFLEHPLWRGIKRQKQAAFDPVLASWKNLPEATLRGYVHDSVFDEWSRGVADSIVDYLLEAIENIDKIHHQIEANRCN